LGFFKFKQNLFKNRIKSQDFIFGNFIKTTKNFTSIKSNKSIGNVKIKRVYSRQLHRCECNPTSFKPCSTDMGNLKICPAGKQCQNQFFAKRQYPIKELILCGVRGWGLRTGLNTIMKKGEFINEYVSEINGK